MAAKPPESYLPLKPATFLVLLVLSTGELHGYGIKKAVAERSSGQIDLEPGTLYRLMARLVGQGLIEEADRRPAPDQDDERRRYYQITELGQRVVTREASRMVRLADSADVRTLAAKP
ncbi:MAG: PadR family transcriptional regulator [Gemmatimonadetes bacterium]|nr:PadR family transcriptional regulator [Gemmatimonadota bacterium]